MQKQNKTVATVIILALLGVIAFGVLTMPDRRSTGERVGDAIDALPEGPGKAAQQLERRTPGERMGDVVKDATDNK